MIIRMEPLTQTEQDTAAALLFSCTEILPEGFRIELSGTAERWAALSRAIGSRRLCAFAADVLAKAYRDTFRKPFLFSERCIAFEIRYHVNAYLWTRGLRRTRHVSTLLLSRARIERTCHSIEIDKTDVYRKSQRILFRYFFGIRPAYRRTQSDPYAKRIGTRWVRVPFYRL